MWSDIALFVVAVVASLRFAGVLDFPFTYVLAAWFGVIALAVLQAGYQWVFSTMGPRHE